MSCFSGRDSGRERQLYNAARDGNVERVKQLLQTTYVDPDPDNDDWTPLIIAGKIFLFSSSDPDPDIKSKKTLILPYTAV